MKFSQDVRVKLSLVISIFGIGDAGFLAYQHFNYNPFECPAFGGCEIVTTSDYAVLFGIPTAFWGVVFYLGMSSLLLWYLLALNKTAIKLAIFGSFTGFIFSLYLVYLQIVVIGAICFYCMLSAATSTFLFLLLGVPFVIAKISSSDRLNKSDGTSNK